MLENMANENQLSDDTLEQVQGGQRLQSKKFSGKASKNTTDTSSSGSYKKCPSCEKNSLKAIPGGYQCTNCSAVFYTSDVQKA